MIVIPMAGRDNRFRDAGYEKPKFMLTWRRKSLFFHALDSFRAYFATERFLIILQDREDARSFVERELGRLGIPKNRSAVIALEDATNGQAETVAVGLRKAEIPPDAPLTIFNIDTFRKDFAYPQDFDLSGIDGYLEVFSEDGENRAFVRPTSDRPGERRVAEILENIRVSDLRCTGLYHFRSCEFYLSLYAEVEGSRSGELQGSGYRIAPLYDQAIRCGADIRYVRISADDVGFFDTPSAYEQRLRETPSDKPLAFCIGGQIRSDRRHLKAIADLARRHDADVYISAWRKRGRKTLRGADGPDAYERLVGRPAAHLLPHGVDLGDMFPKVEQFLADLPSEDCYAELKAIFPDAVIDIEEDDALDLALDAADANKHSLPMLYKIWRCNKLKRVGETLRGRKYEGVARFLPDILPSMKVFTATKMQPDMAAVLPEKSEFLHDVFWLCGSETDDHLSNLFGKAVTGPDQNWKNIRQELERWTADLLPALKRDRARVGISKSASPQDQTLIRSLVCEALRNGQYSDLADLTPDDAKIMADLIECSGNPSVAGLTIGRLRSMHSAKSALVVVKGILISALSISEPPHEDPALHHCADLILLTMTAELNLPQINMDIVRRLHPFLIHFRKVDPNAEPLLQSTPNARQSYDLWKEFSNLLRSTSSLPLGELVWTVHRDLLDRLGKERFLTIAHSIRDLGNRP